MAVGTAPTAAQPGSMFGLPGITRPTEQIENNDGLSTTIASATVTSVTGQIPFKQTDVVEAWLYEPNLTNTVTLGTGTVATSQYFPDNFIGQFRLSMQNQFYTIDVENGIDLALFQLLRPYRLGTDFRNELYTSPGSPYSAEGNLVSSSSYTSASSPIKRVYELPGGLWFDQFHPLDQSGRIVGPPVATFVSPQYMGGTARLVTPVITYNAAIGSVNDTSPYVITAAGPTFTGSVVHNWKRIGYYQPQGVADSPVLWNWQLTRKTQRFSLSGVSKANLLAPINGQILTVYVRLYDPAANSGRGGAIALGANVNECDVVYGSGLFRYQDRPAEMQARLFAQHQTLLPVGVMAWDFAIDQRGRITNQYALNTLNTSGIQVQLTFAGTLSSSAYAVMGVEALQWVQAG